MNIYVSRYWYWCKAPLNCTSGVGGGAGDGGVLHSLQQVYSLLLYSNLQTNIAMNCTIY